MRRHTRDEPWRAGVTFGTWSRTAPCVAAFMGSETGHGRRPCTPLPRSLLACRRSLEFSRRGASAPNGLHTVVRRTSTRLDDVTRGNVADDLGEARLRPVSAARTVPPHARPHAPASGRPRSAARRPEHPKPTRGACSAAATRPRVARGTVADPCRGVRRQRSPGEPAAGLFHAPRGASRSIGDRALPGWPTRSKGARRGYAACADATRATGPTGLTKQFSSAAGGERWRLRARGARGRIGPPFVPRRLRRRVRR